MEFAHYFTSVGTKTTVIQRGGQVLKELDYGCSRDSRLIRSERPAALLLFVGTNIVQR